MNGRHKHLSRDPKHPQPNTSSTNQTTTQEITLKSTPRNPGQEIHSPILLSTSQTKIQTQKQQSDADPCITILRAARAGARRQPNMPRDDLSMPHVDLATDGERC
jgi:hypothetical protein